MLELVDVHAYYGTSHVLFGVSLKADRGEVVALLGRNGVGKSTTMRAIMGLTRARAGSIRFQGAEITRMSTHAISRLGVGYVPEDRQVFPELTVRENLQVAQSGGRRTTEGWSIERVYDLFPPLQRLDRRKAGDLSGGEQQMLTIARTLMINPKLILLDEPSQGLAPVMVQALLAQLHKVTEAGIPMLISEQNVPFATRICDRAYVLEKGQICFAGAMADLQKNEDLVRKHLVI